MINKLKHSIILKFILILWILLFAGYSYIQFGSIHSHNYNGRVIVHSHLAKNHSETNHQPDKNNDHSHTKEEFMMYSSFALLFVSILVISILLFFAIKVSQIKPQTYNSYLFNFISGFFSLRAPPLV